MSLIVTLTMNPSVDKSAAIDRVAPERKLRCNTPRFEPGGGGINVARVIHRLGGRVKALFTAGGPPGDHLQKLLARDGLAHRILPVKAWTRENLSVYETATSQQYRFGMPGPDLAPAEWERCLEVLKEEAQQADYVVASGSLPGQVPDDFYKRVADLIRDTGARFVLDASGAPLKKGAPGSFFIKPNQRELELITGREIEGEADQEARARELIRDSQTEAVVVSLGAGGARLITSKKNLYFHSPTVPIKSKVGAGDSMVAGIVFGLSEGRELADAVGFGVAAGAAAVMSPGSELARPEDIEALFQQMKGEHYQPGS